MNVTASRLSTSVHSARCRISTPPAKIGVGLQCVVHCVETSRRPASMNANRNKPRGRSWPREFVSPHRKTEHGTACMGEPRAVGDLVHVEKFFARNLGGLTRARTRAGPAREGTS